MKKTLSVLIIMLLLIPSFAFAESNKLEVGESISNESVRVTLKNLIVEKESTYTKVVYKLEYEILDDTKMSGIILGNTIALDKEKVNFNHIENSPISKGTHEYTLGVVYDNTKYQFKEFVITIPLLERVVHISGE